MRLLLNLIWLVFGGLVLALGYAVAALVMLILIITIPFGIAAGRMALFCLWPFGRTIVRRADAGIASTIGNVIWFVLAGWWLALGHLISGDPCGVLVVLAAAGAPGSPCAPCRCAQRSPPCRSPRRIAALDAWGRWQALLGCSLMAPAERPLG